MVINRMCKSKEKSIRYLVCYDVQVGIKGKNEGRENQTFICKHDFRLDDEIGEICRKCSWVATEIKYVWPPVVSMA